MRKFILSVTLYLSVFCLKGQSLTVNPNPFALRTQVCYTLTAADTITIVIYNKWGQEILSLVSNSNTPAGVYCDSLSMDTFTDNIYILTFKNRQKNLVNKQIIKSTSTSINEMPNDLPIRIYPNPAKNLLKIEFEGTETESARLALSNTLGQEVYSLNNLNQKQEIDLNFLPSGIYFLKLKDYSGQKTFKIIKE